MPCPIRRGRPGHNAGTPWRAPTGQEADDNPESEIMRILGIDPGLAQTGYGVIDVGAGTGPPHLVEADAIRDRLAADAGIALEDGPDGTTWRFK